MKQAVSYTVMSPTLLEIRWPEEIDKSILMAMLSLKNKIQQKWGEQLWDIRMGYNTICLKFRVPLDLDPIIESINVLKVSDVEVIDENRGRWTIPVIYKGKDLQKIADHHDLTVQEVVDIHTKPSYLIHFFGFLPGFMYLGGLDKRLHTSRKDHPERKIEAGSVAIGGQQTGIYPNESPGGWHVIGQTPVSLFDLKNDPPIQLKVGDEIQFKAVEEEEMEDILEMIANKKYDLGYESI